MTERELEILRFDRVNVSEVESGGSAYHYYYYNVVGGLSFITNSSDEVVNDKWYVEIFNTDVPIRFFDMNQVLGLINTLNKAKVN